MNVSQRDIQWIEERYKIIIPVIILISIIIRVYIFPFTGGLICNSIKIYLVSTARRTLPILYYIDVALGLLT